MRRLNPRLLFAFSAVLMACHHGGLPDGGAPPDGAAAIDATSGDMYQPSFLVLAQYPNLQHGLVYAQGAVFALDYRDDTVLAFDATTYAKVATIKVGIGPGQLVTDGNYVFVINRMAKDTTDAYVSIIDAKLRALDGHELDVAVHMQGDDPNNYPSTNFPWGGTLLNGRLYVDFPTNAEPDIIPVDIGTFLEHPLFPQLPSAAPTVLSGPSDLAGYGTHQLFVINLRSILSPDDDAVYLMTSDGTVQKKFETGGALHGVLVANGKAWVSHVPKGKGQLDILDPVTLTAGNVAVSAGPYGLAEHNGKIYAMCQYDRKVDIVDEKTERVVETVDLSVYQPAITNPRAIAVSPLGDIYVESEGMISVIIRHDSGTGAPF